MIRVGFIVKTDKWLGGINYLKNLLYAVSLLKDRNIETVIFLGTKGHKNIEDMFFDYAQIVRTPFLDQYSLVWFLWKGFEFLGLGNLVFEPFLLSQGIQVLSHSDKVGFKKIRSVNWIPDFQHRHLQAMFDAPEIAKRDNHYRILLEKSDRVIVSSQDAFKDAIAFVPEAVSRISVLPFVAQPDPKVFRMKKEDVQQIKQKYNLPERFCFLPNQFWKHKNHIVVFEALSQLKQEGFGVFVVCSGSLDDYRNPEHVETLKKFIADHHLQENIFLLGQLPYEDVGLLYAAASIVINPSLFEGWSTSVEESKSIGKKILLSDIPVHREQSPRGGVYFNPHDPRDLAKQLRAALAIEDTSASFGVVDDLQKDLNERTQIFGASYQRLIEDVLSAPSREKTYV